MSASEEWALGLHRAIVIAVGRHESRGVLHDDFHHFRVAVRHDGARVLAVAAETRRGPYSLCPRAGEELARLAGLALPRSVDTVSGAVSLRLQCTHQFDLAALVIAATSRGRDCRYDVAVRADSAEAFSGAVARDGAQLLAWRAAHGALLGPEPFTGQSLGVGFSQWVARTLEPGLAEAALVLRRGFVLASARRHIPRLDSLASALPTGNCWVQQAGTAETAARLHGVVRDYSAGTVPIDQDGLDWLAAAGR